MLGLFSQVSRLDAKKLRMVGRVLVLVFGLWTIWTWQKGFTLPTAKIEATQRVTASTGLNEDRKFFFFLYHLGLYPVATSAKITADTKAEAKRILVEEPKTLFQDQGTTFRSGDRGRTFLYFVDAWFRHDAVTPSVKPANRYAFTLALCALFVSAWAIHWTLRGALLVFLIGSNPFQLYVTYVQENVFSWSITIMTFFLAIHLPLFERRGKVPPWYPWVAALLTGVLMAIVRNFRSEPSVMLAGAMLIFLTMGWRPWKVRLGAIALMLACVFAGQKLSVSFLEKKFEKTAAVVTKVGGSAYNGPREYHHEFWHPVFCGLGDFDTKYGYEWQDLTAFRYALPTLEKMHPDLKFVPFLFQPRTWDAAGVYPVMFFETPGYHDIIRKKVVGDIKRDPKWYVDILEKRVDRILERTSSVGFATNERNFYLNGGLVGYACVPLLLLLLVTRRWTEVKLLLFSTPLSIAPLAIYSDGGMTYYSCFQLFGFFIMLLLVWEAVRARWKRYGRDAWLRVFA